MPKYSVEFKKNVLKYFDSYGKIKTCKKYGIPHSTIYRWKRKSETVGFMRKQTKTYKAEEKIDILKYFWSNGYTETERKYDVNAGLINKWERQFKEYGYEGLSFDGRGRKSKNMGPKKDINNDQDLLEEVQRLRMENQYLKKLDALVREREERESKKKQK